MFAVIETGECETMLQMFDRRIDAEKFMDWYIQERRDRFLGPDVEIRTMEEI